MQATVVKNREWGGKFLASDMAHRDQCRGDKKYQQPGALAFTHTYRFSHHVRFLPLRGKL